MPAGVYGTNVLAEWLCVLFEDRNRERMLKSYLHMDI